MTIRESIGCVSAHDPGASAWTGGASSSGCMMRHLLLDAIPAHEAHVLAQHRGDQHGLVGHRPLASFLSKLHVSSSLPETAQSPSLRFRYETRAPRSPYVPA